MGLGILFDQANADLSGIAKTNQNIFVSQIKHKTFVTVNEKGTEAAGATSVMVEAGANLEEPFSMIVNRPFIFLIQDFKTEAILFLGVVADPKD